MARYFFDITDGTGFHGDNFGDEFEGFEEAHAQAQALLPDIARGELRDTELRIIKCDVRDDTGRVLYRSTLTFEGIREPA